MNIRDNLKDNVGTIMGLFAAICGFLVIIAMAGVPISKTIIIICGAAPSFCTAVIGVFQGKNPNGSTKTPTQVTNQNNEAAVTKEP
jgi:hypothetical protein